MIADPSMIPGAVDETLRFDPSVTVWRRITTRPATLGGLNLPEGARLFLWLAARPGCLSLPRSAPLRSAPAQR